MLKKLKTCFVCGSKDSVVVSEHSFVFILTRDCDPWDKDRKMAKKYLNRFSIEEDDQFEIYVKDYPDKYWFKMRHIDYYKAAKEVMLEAQQG